MRDIRLNQTDVNTCGTQQTAQIHTACLTPISLKCSEICHVFGLWQHQVEWERCGAAVEVLTKKLMPG